MKRFFKNACLVLIVFLFAFSFIACTNVENTKLNGMNQTSFKATLDTGQTINSRKTLTDFLGTPVREGKVTGYIKGSNSPVDCYEMSWGDNTTEAYAKKYITVYFYPYSVSADEKFSSGTVYDYKLKGIPKD